MSELVTAAKAFAWTAHAGQKRKYCGSPYICHSAHVVGILERAGITDPEVLAAGWLHDTVEDNEHVENMDIRILFGSRVAELVEEVTNPSKREDGNRAIRKEIDRQHIRNASPDGQTLKLADIISNTESIIQNDKNFAKVYMGEKKMLLEFLQDGSPILLEEVEKIVAEYYSVG